MRHRVHRQCHWQHLLAAFNSSLLLKVPTTFNVVTCTCARTKRNKGHPVLSLLPKKFALEVCNSYKAALAGHKPWFCRSWQKRIHQMYNQSGQAPHGSLLGSCKRPQGGEEFLTWQTDHGKHDHQDGAAANNKTDAAFATGQRGSTDGIIRGLMLTVWSQRLVHESHAHSVDELCRRILSI